MPQWSLRSLIASSRASVGWCQGTWDLTHDAQLLCSASPLANAKMRLLSSPSSYHTTPRSFSEFIVDHYRLVKTIVIRNNDLSLHDRANGREVHLYGLRSQVRGARDYFEVK